MEIRKPSTTRIGSRDDVVVEGTTRSEGGVGHVHVTEIHGRAARIVDLDELTGGRRHDQLGQ